MDFESFLGCGLKNNFLLLVASRVVFAAVRAPAAAVGFGARRRAAGAEPEAAAPAAGAHWRKVALGTPRHRAQE